MKIIVKISDIEVVINRPNFSDAKSTEQDKSILKDTILPTLNVAVEKTKELYNNRIEQLNKNL